MGIDDYWPPFVDRLVSASEIALLITSSVPPKSKVSKVRHAVGEGPHATGVGFIQAMPVARRVLHARSVGRLGATGCRRAEPAVIPEKVVVRRDMPFSFRLVDVRPSAHCDVRLWPWLHS